LLHAFPVSNNISVLISKIGKITKFVTAARHCNDLLEPFLNELRDDELTEGYCLFEKFFYTPVIEFPARSSDLTIIE
jgi:hypothetical protein